MSNITLGAEEEFYIVDNKSMLPMSVEFNDIIKLIPKSKQCFFSPEIHKCMIETKTDICKTDEVVINELFEARKILKELLLTKNLSLMPVGNHPLSNAIDMELQSHSPYDEISHEYQSIAKLNSVCGLHFHIGVPEKDIVYLFNELRNIIPYFNALSAYSSHFNGQDTGLRSFRYRLFKLYPRSNYPENINNLDQYFQKIDFLIKTGSISKSTSLWNDMRIHPVYKTIEIRSLDMQPDWEMTKAIISLIYSYAQYFIKERPSTNIIPTYILEENAWRACRRGIDTGFISDLDGNIVNGIEIIKLMIEKTSPYISDYTARNLDYLNTISLKKIDLNNLSREII